MSSLQKLHIEQTEQKEHDDNDAILKRIQKNIDSCEHTGVTCSDYIRTMLSNRLDVGRKRYGHGVIVDSDTSQWTENKTDDWLSMADEEFYDGLIYLAAARIRHERKHKKHTHIDNAMKYLLMGIHALHENTH